MDGTPTALKNGSRKCRSKSSAPLGLVHFRELFFAPSAPPNARPSLPLAASRSFPKAIVQVIFFARARCKLP
jgi:hypothetical protein